MRKVAVFGNAGGGKSTLSRRLAEITGLPLYPVDAMEWRAGGGAVPREEFHKAHAEVLARDEWIIDGYGSRALAWERFARADTLVYVDLPFLTHFRWITKRFVKGLYVNPEGWPERSPIVSSHVQSYRVLFSCHRHLTPQYRTFVEQARASTRVHHIRSPGEIRAFLAAVAQETRGA